VGLLNWWLRRLLTFDELDYYRHTLGALAETFQVQLEIDAVIPNWPLT